MRVTTGRVLAGRIEVPGETFVEGQVMTVLAPEENETFTLTPEAEAALLAAMAEGERGDMVSAEELFREGDTGSAAAEGANRFSRLFTNVRPR